MKLDPYVGLDPRICDVNLLNVIITTSYYKTELNLLEKNRAEHLNLERSQNSTKLEPNIGLHPRI